MQAGKGGGIRKAGEVLALLGAGAGAGVLGREALQAAGMGQMFPELSQEEEAAMDLMNRAAMAQQLEAMASQGVIPQQEAQAAISGLMGGMAGAQA